MGQQSLPSVFLSEGKHYALLSTAKCRPHCQRRSLNRIRDVGCWLAGEVQIHPDPCTAGAENSLNALSPSSGENPFERNHAEGREGGT